MTDAQAIQLAKSPTTKKALAIINKFAQAEAAFKQLEVEKKEAEAKIIEAMDAHGIPKLEGDWGTITLAARKTFRAIGEINDEFTKKAIDTKKVGAYYTLNGDLPVGVEVNETKYLVKKLK
jgi:hypothetical protein